MDEHRHHRRRARDRGDSRSRSPERSNHRRGREEDGYGRRDRRHSRSRSPRRARNHGEGRTKELDDYRVHDQPTTQSRSRGRSVTPRDHRSNSPYSPVSSASIESQPPVMRSRYKSSSRSPARESRRVRHRSRSHSRDRDNRKMKQKEKDGDRKRRHKDKDRKKQKEEKRSVLTGKKIKLKIHKDSKDLEMDANREDLLQFLNSTFE